MADSKTTHLELIKQDPNKAPDIAKEHSNLDKLDEEVYKRAKSVNGVQTGEDGGIQLRMVPYAENLETSASQSSDEEFIIRTTGGDASLEDGDAWLTLLRGSRKHTGYTAQSVDMSVIPMARPVPAAITAELNIATFEAYVQQAGTYTISYTDSWSTSPATYGITVSNTPIDGDSITVVWDGENDPVMTVNAVERTAPPAITAPIDVATFVSYVSQSGTTTLTYSTAWSADPANYGITVTNDPIAGDVIQVIYVKEVRGLITQSTPETFVSTGWNLYDHSKGYARLIKYSTQYNFKISGTYTALEFAETLSGTRQTITPVSGAFSIPSDGYLFVTGGNNTDTAIWMTWSDWGMGYNWNSTTGQQGAFAPYAEDVIDISTFMANNFPYGLMQVGTVRDEINLNIGIATSRVVRQAYNATNLANAKASGRQYEYDENYIYIERDTAVYYTIEVDGGYAAYDHGMELFTGTEQAVYTQTLYGQNLKNKLERDVLTISQQTLTAAQKVQVQQNLNVPDKSVTDALNSMITIQDLRKPIVFANTQSGYPSIEITTGTGWKYIWAINNKRTVITEYNPSGIQTNSWSFSDTDSITEYTASQSMTVSKGTVSGNTVVLKQGNTVQLCLIINSVTASNGTLLAQLNNSIGIRPRKTRYIPIFNYDNGIPFNGSVYFEADGKLTYYGDSISNKTILLSETYIAGT